MLFLVAGGAPARGGAAEFADVLIAFDPAPGQFVNNPAFNDPADALGPPIGAGTSAPSNAKIVSLGGFAGSITLGFSQTVLDDPCNPYGLDAIIFGNAFYAGGNANRRWAEGAVIEISRDENANGLADDPWFVIPGSHLSQVPADDIESQVWDADTGDPAHPPSNPAWIPPGHGGGGVWETIGYRLPALFEAAVVQNPNGLSATLEGYFGYADCAPVLLLGDIDADGMIEIPGMDPAEFYTAADNPFVVGVDAGSGGGDSFDIAWAVDPVDGLPARLDGFDFIRISTGVNFIAGVFGEISAEIGGASDARADASFYEVDGAPGVDVEDLYAWHAASPMDFTGEQTIDGADSDLLERCVRRGEVADVTSEQQP